MAINVREVERDQLFLMPPALPPRVDRLAEAAASRCVDLHPWPAQGTPCRKDGRPLSEQVTDRRLTTPAVLDQEGRLLAWAGSDVAVIPPGVEDPKAVAARAVGGSERLVLGVGPAGAGKTTMLGDTAASLRQQDRAAIGWRPRARRPTSWRTRPAGRPPRWPSCSTSTLGLLGRCLRGSC